MVFHWVIDYWVFVIRQRMDEQALRMDPNESLDRNGENETRGRSLRLGPCFGTLGTRNVPV